MTIRFPNPVAPSTQSNVSSAQPAPAASQAQQAQQAWANDRAQLGPVVATLMQHFGEAGGSSFFGGGTIDMNELYAAASGQKGGPEVQQAAAWLLQRPQFVRELDARGNGKADGKISLGDLKLEVQGLSREQQLQSMRYDPRLGQFEQSLGTIASAFGSFDTAKQSIFGNRPDGKISRDDLNRILTGNYPQPLREAAFFLTSNPDLMGMLDTGSKGGRPDGTISVNDVQTMMTQLGSVRASMPQTMPSQSVPRY